MGVLLATISQFGLNHLLDYADALRRELIPYVDAVIGPLSILAMIAAIISIGYSIVSNWLNRELQNYIRPLVRPLLVLVVLQNYDTVAYYTLVLPGELMYEIALEGYDQVRADNIFSTNGYNVNQDGVLEGIGTGVRADDINTYKSRRMDYLSITYPDDEFLIATQECRQGTCAAYSSSAGGGTTEEIKGENFDTCMEGCLDQWYLEADSYLISTGEYTATQIAEYREALQNPDYKYFNNDFKNNILPAFWVGFLGVIQFFVMVVANLASVFVVLRSVVAVTIFYALGPYVLMLALVPSNENIIMRYWMYVMGIRLWPMLTVVVTVVISQVPFFKHPEYSGYLGGLIVPFLSIILSFLSIASLWAIPAYSSVLVYYTASNVGRDLGKSISQAATGDRGIQGFGKKVAGETIGRMYNRFNHGTWSRARHHTLFSDRRNPDAQKGEDMKSKTDQSTIARMQRGIPKAIIGETFGRLNNFVREGTFSRKATTTLTGRKPMDIHRRVANRILPGKKDPFGNPVPRFQVGKSTNGESLKDTVSKIGVAAELQTKLLSGDDTDRAIAFSRYILDKDKRKAAEKQDRLASKKLKQKQKEEQRLIDQKIARGESVVDSVPSTPNDQKVKEPIASYRGASTAYRMNTLSDSAKKARLRARKKAQERQGASPNVNQTQWVKNDKGEWERKQASDAVIAMREDSRKYGDDILQGKQQQRTDKTLSEADKERQKTIVQGRKEAYETYDRDEAAKKIASAMRLGNRRKGIRDTREQRKEKYEELFRSKKTNSEVDIKDYKVSDKDGKPLDQEASKRWMRTYGGVKPDPTKDKDIGNLAEKLKEGIQKDGQNESTQEGQKQEGQKQDQKEADKNPLSTKEAILDAFKQTSFASPTDPDGWEQTQGSIDAGDQLGQGDGAKGDRLGFNEQEAERDDDYEADDEGGEFD